MFEVRITAYERPGLLLRALQSLQTQTYRHWTATVFDDSSTKDVSDLVRALGDRRINYCRNPKRLGAAGNIDQCFAPVSMTGGMYACLLEDDNFWMPDFLGILAAAVHNSQPDLILANQKIFSFVNGLLPEGNTTRGDWFDDGTISPLELRASLLLMEGLSNGGVVWRLGSGVDLRVGLSVRETGLHEACRSLLVDRRMLFIAGAHAVWTEMPKSDSARSTESNRVIARGMQALRSAVLRLHGAEAVAQARGFAAKLGLEDRLVDALAYCGRPELARGLLYGRRAAAVRAVAKGIAVRVVQPDPCAEFLRVKRIPSI